MVTSAAAGGSLKWCAVPLGDVMARGRRLEASVFDTDAAQARRQILQGRYPAVPLTGPEGLASAYVRGRFKRVWVKRSDLPIFQPSAITELRPAPDGYLSRRTQTDIEALRVRKGQVLLTCSGTVGKAAYVSDTLDGAVFSHDLLRLTCRRPWDAGYLYAYLKSPAGSRLLLTNRYGAVVTHIEPEHLAAVPIPAAPEGLRQEIHRLVADSYALRDHANRQLDQAEALLLETLDLPPFDRFAAAWDEEAVSVFSVRQSRLEGRADASYHVPIAGAILARLACRGAELTTVGDPRVSRQVLLPGRFKRVYVGAGYGRPFFGGKQLGELDPSGQKFLSLKKHGGRIVQELELHENYLLITRSGTVGKTALVPRHWEGWVASEDVIRVIPASAGMAGYLSLFLASPYGQTLLERYTYGSVVSHIDDTHVRRVPVPLLEDTGAQEEIGRLVLTAQECRCQAYQLERTALETMVREVLGDGE